MDSLGPQFINHKQLADMYSGDWDVKMPKALDEMRKHDNDPRRQPEDRHPAYGSKGTPGSHVAALTKDIAANGMREPIEIRGDNVIKDGNHRALAALRLRMDKIPVVHKR